MEEVAIRVDNISKSFMLPHQRSSSIKGIFVNIFRGNKTYEKQQVLKDISLEVAKGEFFGIVGRNGSGKSTLLKLLAGIYNPDAGGVYINGKLTPFIELGVGFNPELTGRENVYLNGALLGFSRREMKGLYDDIVEFAELEKFMDQKLKNYSSGMQVRLAFSIAIRAESEILVLDEVLAVGDEAFQRKCYNYFLRLKREKRTVILVTHDMSAVEKYCDRAMMLDSARVVTIGKPREVALRYEIANTKTNGDSGNTHLERPKNPPVQIEKISFSGKDKLSQRLSGGEDISFDVHFKVRKSRPIQFNLYIIDKEGRYVAGINTTKNINKTYSPSVGKHTLKCLIEKGQLNKGEYTVQVGVYSAEYNPELIDVYDNTYGVACPVLIITDKFEDRDGLIYIRAQWEETKKSNQKP